MKYISIVLIFLTLPFITNLKIWLLFFSLFLFLNLSISYRCLRLSMGVRVWLFLFLFLLITSFDFSTIKISYESLIKNFKIFLHFYSFNVLINLINDNISSKKIYDFMIKRGMIKPAFYIIFLIVVFKKILSNIMDVFSYYVSENKKLDFIKNIDKLFYSCIREAVKVSFTLSENFVIRRIYDEEG